MPSEPVPLLMIDVDGVISLFGFAAGHQQPPGRMVMVDGLPHFLADHAGDRLTRLSRSFEMVWCTGWEERAAEHLPHLLGLTGAAYPHLVFDGFDGQPGRHWKLDAIDAHAGADRALAWVDDGHDERTREWAAQRPGPTELVTTNPAVGLTYVLVEKLEEWAAELSPSSPACRLE